MIYLQQSFFQKMQNAQLWRNMIVKIVSQILKMILVKVMVQQIQSFEMKVLMILLSMKFFQRQMSTHKVDMQLMDSKKNFLTLPVFRACAHPQKLRFSLPLPLYPE